MLYQICKQGRKGLHLKQVVSTDAMKSRSVHRNRPVRIMLTPRCRYRYRVDGAQLVDNIHTGYYKIVHHRQNQIAISVQMALRRNFLEMRPWPRLD
jgi:hypothetical protein